MLRDIARAQESERKRQEEEEEERLRARQQRALEKLRRQQVEKKGGVASYMLAEFIVINMHT